MAERTVSQSKMIRCWACHHYKIARAHGLCYACVTEMRSHGHFLQHPLRYKADVYEDWLELERQGYSRPHAAQRLGMSKDAMDAAIGRHKRANNIPTLRDEQIAKRTQLVQRWLSAKAKKRSRAEFCALNGISVSTLESAVKAYNHQNQTSHDVDTNQTRHPWVYEGYAMRELSS